MLISTKGRLCLLTGSLLSFGFAHTANAQNSLPTFSAEMVVELQNEYTPSADDESIEDYNNMFLRSELAATLQFNENFYIDGVAVFENIQDRDPNESNFFDNEGIFIEEIKLNYERGAWGAFAGKFNPGFGIAWDYGRGIWGEDFAEDYEITERLGFGASYTFDTESYGAHTLTASTFFADTTFLSGSVITQRDLTDKDDGGVSNTEDFSSYVVSLEGENLAGVENLYYKLGYRNQDEGDETVGGDRETGYVVTLGHVMPVGERVSVDGLLEFADIHNFDASDSDNQYLTASFITTIDDKWNVTASYTARNVDGPSGDTDDHLFQLSGGYDFGQGTTAELGWRNAEEGDQDSDIIGGLIRHTFEF